MASTTKATVLDPKTLSITHFIPGEYEEDFNRIVSHNKFLVGDN